MKRILGYFLKGLLVFVPVALTVTAIAWTFSRLDGLFREIMHITIPGLGLLVTVAFITTVGFVASNFLGRRLFAIIDSIFARVPLVKLLYSSIKDFIEAFAGEKKSFDKPVVVELFEGGAKAAGFVTREDLEFLSLPGDVAVYLPQSYNFAGSVLIFPKERVKPLDVDSSAAMAFIVSGGVVGPSQ